MTDTATRTEIVHSIPRGFGPDVTPCCQTDVDDLPTSARMTSSPVLANCPGRLYVVVVGPSSRCSVFGPTSPERAIRHRDDVASEIEAHGMAGTVRLMREVEL